MQPLEFWVDLKFPWITDPTGFLLTVLILSLLLLAIALERILSLRRYKRRTEIEMDRICKMLCHLEARYEESCPAVTVAARYVMFSKFANDDEELALLDELLRVVIK